MLSIYFKVKIKTNFILYRFSFILYLFFVPFLAFWTFVLLWFSVIGNNQKEGAS